ncbi:hypothetical protein V2J09_006880 [Rumex salicifolius]
MATAAFRSTSKRTSIGSDGTRDSRASTRGSTADNRRRARSVSRFSHLIPSESTEFIDQTSATPAVETRGKFVNKARGTAFPEISLDDLAIELFSSGERGRSSEVSTATAPSHRRGRSVSRQATSRLAGERKSVVSRRSYGGGGGSAVTGGRVVSDRRRRSLSVVRYRASDSESDNSEMYSGQFNCQRFSSVNKQAAVHKQAAPSQQRGLRRCSSQRDFLKSNNSDLHNDLGEVKRKELRRSVDEIKVRDREEFCKLVNGGSLQQKNLDVSRARTYSTKLEQAEKRKQELRAQIMLEEQHHNELKRVVGEWLPHAKETCASRRPARTRKRSNDRRRISNLLTEEADKIIEDFISSVEDNTDISSFDGDRSDTSSSFGAAVRPRDVLMHFGEPENYRTLTRIGSVPVGMDGVVLPWLQWETTESPCKDKKQTPATPKTVLQDTIEETSNANKTEQSNQSNSSSRGSWSPAIAESFSVDSETSKTTTKPVETRKSQLLKNVPRRSSVVDIQDYLTPQSNDEILFERWKLEARISSGGILLKQDMEQNWGQQEIALCPHDVDKLIVFPRTKVTNESSTKNIVVMSALSILQPKIVTPPGLDWMYKTAKFKRWIPD